MEESIQTNENNKDMFNINIPSFDAGTEIPSPPVSESSEIENFASKSLISFGTMIICIVLFLVLAFILKKRKEQSESTTIEETIITESNEEQNEYNISEIKKSKSYLNTPSNIQKCIKSFLENTKEN